MSKKSEIKVVNVGNFILYTWEKGEYSFTESDFLFRPWTIESAVNRNFGYRVMLKKKVMKTFICPHCRFVFKFWNSDWKAFYNTDLKKIMRHLEKHGHEKEPMEKILNKIEESVIERTEVTFFNKKRMKDVEIVIEELENAIRDLEEINGIVIRQIEGIEKIEGAKGIDKLLVKLIVERIKKIISFLKRSKELLEKVKKGELHLANPNGDIRGEEIVLEEGRLRL